MLDPEAVARAEARAQEVADKKAAGDAAKAKEQEAAAREKVRAAIPSGAIKGITAADWDLLSSAASAEA